MPSAELQGSCGQRASIRIRGKSNKSGREIAACTIIVNKDWRHIQGK